jgi:hypothetical protein
MQTVVLQGNSPSDIKLLTDLAKKLGIMVKYLSEEEKEDLGMLKAIKTARTQKYVDTQIFIDKLRQ